MNQTADRFLDLYREMESEIRERYFQDGDNGHEGVLSRALREVPDIQQFRDELNTCREVRNYLSHNRKIDGEYAVFPSPQLIEILENTLQAIKNPPTVMQIAVGRDQMLQAKFSDRALWLLRQMHRRGFSHVPVMHEGRLAGVFSESSVAAYLCDAACGQIADTAQIRDFADYIGFARHTNETFAFVGADTSLPTVEEIYRRAFARHKRLSLIFITEHGQQDERLIGLITPYDVLAHEDD